MAVKDGNSASLATRRPPAQPSHRRSPALVDEDQAFRIEVGLAVDPGLSRRARPGAPARWHAPTFQRDPVPDKKAMHGARRYPQRMFARQPRRQLNKYVLPRFDRAQDRFRYTSIGASGCPHLSPWPHLVILPPLPVARRSCGAIAHSRRVRPHDYACPPDTVTVSKTGSCGLFSATTPYSRPDSAGCPCAWPSARPRLPR